MNTQRNRKPETELLDIDRATPLPMNAKLHAAAKITTSVKRFGFLEPVILNRTTGHLLAGHGRLESLRAMRDLGDAPPDGVTIRAKRWLVPCHVVHVPKEKEYVAAVALNRLVELGGWNLEELEAALATDDPELLDATGFAMDDFPDAPELPDAITPTVPETCTCDCGHEHARKTKTGR